MSTEVSTQVDSNTEDQLGTEDWTSNEDIRVRGFILTVYESNWEKFIAGLNCKKPIIEFWIYKKEECPQTKKIHWHAVIYYRHPQGLKGFRNRFFGIWSRCVKNIKAAIDYVRKEESKLEDPVQWGTEPQQGRRTDLESVALSIKEGRQLNEVAEEAPEMFIRYHKGLTELRNIYFKDRKEPPQVIWIWGLAGVGKTKEAYEKSESVYIKDGTMWWNGYEQQEVIVIDDFDGKWPYRDLLRLLDRYPYQAQVKGGYVKINSPYIYITCEYPPAHFWSGNELEQVLRRVTEVKNKV